MAANWTAFVSGDVLTAAQLNGVVDNFADIALFNETQANNTQGGTFTSGSYLKRTLNTTIVNNIASCTLTSSVVSLPAGTYYMSAIGSCWGNLTGVQSRIANTTASTYSYGQSMYWAGGVASSGNTTVSAVVTITATSNFELQSRTLATVNTNGFGVGANLGNNEIYSQLLIARIA